jgi:hypothetical protein
MVNIELISDNIPLIISEIVNIQEIAKYLYYNVSSPQSQPDLALPANNLIMTKVFPYPFLSTSVESDCSHIRIYYPDGVFDESGEVLGTSIFFDIVVAKSLWLVNDGKSSIRPYMIMHYLSKHFQSKSIGTLGRICFSNFVHLNVDERFDAIRLQADMTIFGGISND